MCAFGHSTLDDRVAGSFLNYGFWGPCPHVHHASVYWAPTACATVARCMVTIKRMCTHMGVTKQTNIPPPGTTAPV